MSVLRVPGDCFSLDCPELGSVVHKLQKKKKCIFFPSAPFAKAFMIYKCLPDSVFGCLECLMVYNYYYKSDGFHTLHLLLYVQMYIRI